MRIENLNVRLPDGRDILRDLNLDLDHGGRLIIMGPSGIGKSTLIRALAGIWPYTDGDVELPKDEVALFLPQKPYLPLGDLRDVLLYPTGSDDIDNERIAAALRLAGLGELSGRLDESRFWAQVLSLGEQQRVAFARIFLLRPDWVFMDEATSALDEPAEGELYLRLMRELPRTAIMSVGHRSSLIAFHESRLILQGEGRWRVEAIPPA